MSFERVRAKKIFCPQAVLEFSVSHIGFARIVTVFIKINTY